jgi:ribosomal protein S21
VVVSEEKGLEKAIKEFKRRNVDVLLDLKRRRHSGPKPGEKRRNRRNRQCQTAACILYTGEYRTISMRYAE